MKAKAAEEVGISLNHITLPENATVEEVVSWSRSSTTMRLSAVSSSSFLSAHTLVPTVNETVTEAVSPEKDVDGSSSF
jgi:methylenetetrahydrofolate dehydrogenase (NADP+)/methenyltetrahydrofolate cyclohydrolase/formyltetrahydrofolate synthetase